MLPVHNCKIIKGLLFPVKQLHNAHPGYVLLAEAVDSADGGAYAAIAFANVIAEEAGDDEDERQDGKSEQGQPPIDSKHEGGHDGEIEKVIDDGQHAGGEHFVDGVHVRGDACDEAADGVSVKEADVHALHVAEDVAAQVEHELLPGPLHEVDLDKLEEVRSKLGA